MDTIDVFEGGRIWYDGFSDYFLESALEFYDTVFIPDCGGNWYTLQDVDINPKEFISLIEKIKIIVKPTGSLWISKIFSDEMKLTLEHYYKRKFITYQDPDESVIQYTYLSIPLR